MNHILYIVQSMYLWFLKIMQISTLMIILNTFTFYNNALIISILLCVKLFIDINYLKIFNVRNILLFILSFCFWIKHMLYSEVKEKHHDKLKWNFGILERLFFSHVINNNLCIETTITGKLTAEVHCCAIRKHDFLVTKNFNKDFA